MQRQIIESYTRRSSSGDVTTQRPHHSCNVQTFQMKSTRNTDAVDSHNISQNANDNPGNFADRQERAPVFRSTWSPTIGKHKPVKQNYIPQGANMVSPTYPGAARENIRISDDEYGRVSDNSVGMPTGGLTQNERSHFIQELEQMSSRLSQNSPAMKQQAQMQYIQSPPAPTQTRLEYIQPQQLITPTDMGYTRPLPRLSPAYAPPIYGPNSQPPQLSPVPYTGYIQPPSRVHVQQTHEATRRPTESFGAWSSLGPTYQLTSESPSPLHSRGRSSPLHSQGRSSTLHSRGRSSPLHSQGRSSPLHSQGRSSTLHSRGRSSPLHSQGRSATLHSQGWSSISSSSSESVTDERRRSSTAQIVSDTLKGAEYNVMYMCDPKNPDIIQKLAIIPNHCLHDHDVCLRRIKQAERHTKRRTLSTDDAADTRRHPSPKRFTQYESEKRRKTILPKTITDRFGVKRRLRLKQRRHGPAYRLVKTRRNIERPRQSDYPRQVHTDDYTHQREVDPWIDVQPRSVHSDEQVRSRRVFSDDSLRAHSAPYDDDIRQRQVTDDGRRRVHVRTGTKARSSSESDSSDENSDSSSDDRDARKKEKKAKKDNKANEEKEAKREKKAKKEKKDKKANYLLSLLIDACAPSLEEQKANKAKKEKKAKKRMRGWLKDNKNLISRRLFPTQGTADVQEVMTPNGRSSYVDQAGYDYPQNDEDWQDAVRPATSTTGTRSDGGNIPNGRVKDKSEDRRQIGFQVPTTDRKRYAVMAGTRQPRTGGTAVRWGSNMYDDQPARQPSVSPHRRSEANIRRTSQYVQDVRKKRKHGKHHHKDKQSKKETEKHARFDQLDTRNLVPRKYPVVPTMNLQRPSDASFGGINDSDESRGVERKSGRRKSKLPAIDDDDGDSEFESDANEIQFWARQIAERKSREQDMRKQKVKVGQGRSAQQRSNNNVGNSYPSITVPDDTLVTSHDEQSRHLWSDQDEAVTADVRTMGQERFRMIRDEFETGTFVSYVCDYVSPSNARIM